MRNIQLTILVILVSFFSITVARDGQSKGLIYIKHTSQSTELIRILDGKKEVIYTLPENGCWAFSPDGIYFAASDQNRSDLIIRKMSSSEVVFQEPYRPEWRTCFMGWQQQAGFSVLGINRRDNQNEVLYYKLVGDNLGLVDFEPLLPDYLELPDWLKSTKDGYILPSPDPSIFLYEKCAGLKTTRSGQTCAVDTDFVIYDTEHDAIKTTLQDVNSPIIERSITPPFDTANGAAWSATGRYLAYPDLFKQPFNLNVYDLSADKYLDTQFSAVDIDWQKELQWSPSGDRLAFWIIGSFNDTDPETYRSLVFFDAPSQQFVVAKQSFKRQTNVAKMGVWSPDGGAFAFIDEDKILYSVDSSDGIVTQLDSDVSSILNST
jgi:hypothetical protein